MTISFYHLPFYNSNPWCNYICISATCLKAFGLRFNMFHKLSMKLPIPTPITPVHIIPGIVVTVGQLYSERTLIRILIGYNSLCPCPKHSEICDKAYYLCLIVICKYECTMHVKDYILYAVYFDFLFIALCK